MARRLRVLVVEDSIEDTFFIVRELQRGGYQVDFERVETAAAMQEALAAGSWDLVISDYRMPQFDGLAALELYRQHNLDIPFIMVSGALGEERAVEIVKRGAHDCVMKDNLVRLVPAVLRESQAAHERRLRKRTEEATAYLASLVQFSDDAIIGEDLAGTILSWNRGAEKLYGYSAVEMIGRPISILFPRELREEAAYILDKVKKGGRIEGLETFRLRKDGAPVEVTVTVSPIRDAAGTIIGASTFARQRLPSLPQPAPRLQAAAAPSRPPPGGG